MTLVSQDALLSAIDRIYEAIERPELWPETIYALGELIGGRRGFWGFDPSIPVDVEDPVNKHFLRAGSHAFFLSREDMRAIDRYTDEFGAIITRFLRVIFMSTLWSQNSAAASEAIGLRISQRFY